MFRWVKERLRAVSLFVDLCDHELDAIAHLANVKTYKPKSLVFLQGEPLTHVFFIYEGVVKIYKTDASGKEQIVSILQNGDMFPHTGFFFRSTYPAHAQIVKETTLVSLSMEHFEQTLMRHPSLCIKLFRIMGEKIVDLHMRLEEHMFHHTSEQLARMLVRLARTNGMQLADGRYRLTTALTNRELANMIGIARETVSRKMSRWKQQGIVTIDEHGHHVIDIHRLL